MDPRFSKLLAEMGEAALLEQCYSFMTFATQRPTEEQRHLLELKFAQDRRYKELREPVAECLPVFGSYYDLENTDLQPKRQVSFGPVNTNIVESVSGRATYYWPAIRTRNFVRYLDAFNEVTWGRVNHNRGLEILAAAANISVMKLLRTDPVTYSKMVHNIGDAGAKKLLERDWFKN